MRQWAWPPGVFFSVIAPPSLTRLWHCCVQWEKSKGDTSVCNWSRVFKAPPPPPFPAEEFVRVEGFLSYIYSVTEGEETASQTVCAAQTPCPCACQVFEVFFRVRKRQFWNRWTLNQDNMWSVRPLGEQVSVLCLPLLLLCLVYLWL